MDAATRLSLRVSPGARHAAVVGRYGDAWKVRVAAAPEKGRANEELLALLASTLGVGQRDLHLVAGSGSRDKIVELRGLSADEAHRRLARAGARETT